MLIVSKDNYKEIQSDVTIDTDYRNRLLETNDIACLNNPENDESVEMPMNNVIYLLSHKRANGVEYDRMFHLALKTHQLGITLNEHNAGRILKKEHSGNVDNYVENYKKWGDTKCLQFPSEWSKDALIEEFQKIRRFNGRLPRILDVMACVSDKYSIEPSDIATKFDIDLVGVLRSKSVPDAEIVLLYTTLPKEHLNRIKDNPELCSRLASFISKGILEDEEKLITIAKWVASHSQTDKETIANLLDNPYIFKINANSSVEKIKVQCGAVLAKDEIKKIEKAYKKPKFKFSECRCELMFSEASNEKYESYILKADDPRQVILGYETNCCQVFGDAGETAMLHGLLNPKAGFWVVVDAETGKLRCQAEVWESDEETLVFDNIEFADDTEIERYKDIIGEWLLNSPYKNVIMGLGYNEMGQCPFEDAPDLVPSVTPREVYVMSYEEDAEIPDFFDRTAPNKLSSDGEHTLLKLKSEEVAKQMLEEGRIDYYDYLYSDVDDEKGMVWLKKDFEIADFFAIEKELQEEKRVSFEDPDRAERMVKYAEAIERALNNERENEKA